MRAFTPFLAVALLPFMADAALAQSRPPADARGFQIQQWMMQRQRQSAPRNIPAPRLTPPARPQALPSDVQITIAPAPVNPFAPKTVLVRGPDGVLRSFPAQGPVVVRPGEAVTIQVPAPPTKE